MTEPNRPDGFFPDRIVSASGSPRPPTRTLQWQPPRLVPTPAQRPAKPPARATWPRLAAAAAVIGLVGLCQWGLVLTKERRGLGRPDLAPAGAPTAAQPNLLITSERPVEQEPSSGPVFKTAPAPPAALPGAATFAATAPARPFGPETGPAPRLVEADDTLPPPAARQPERVPVPDPDKARNGDAGAATAAPPGEPFSFRNMPEEAAKKARQDEKLVLVLQSSGEWQNGQLTDPFAEAFRQKLEADRTVIGRLSQEFVPASLRGGSKDASGGNVRFALYFCLSDANGSVLHAVAAPDGPEEVLAEAEWALNLRRQAFDASSGGKDLPKYCTVVKTAHAGLFRSEYDPAGPGPEPAPDGKKGPWRRHHWRFNFAPPDAFPPPAPPKAKPIPAAMPKSLSEQGKMHWLLQARATQVTLPTLQQIAPEVWRDILRQH